MSPYWIGGIRFDERKYPFLRLRRRISTSRAKLSFQAETLEKTAEMFYKNKWIDKKM